MASFEDICWLIVKTILWVVGIFYLLPILLIMVFDFYEFLMLGDSGWGKFNWIGSVQKVHNFYGMFVLKAQEVLPALKR